MTGRREPWSDESKAQGGKIERMGKKGVWAK